MSAPRIQIGKGNGTIASCGYKIAVIHILQLIQEVEFKEGFLGYKRRARSL